jgi:hypothetical protein
MNHSGQFVQIFHTNLSENMLHQWSSWSRRSLL